MEPRAYHWLVPIAMRGMDVHGLPLLFPFTTYWVLIDFFQSHYSSQPLFPYSDVNGGLCLILPRSFSPHLPGWEIERDRRACVCASVCVSPTFSTVCFPSLYVLCVSRLAEGSVSDVPMCVAWGGQGVSGLSHPNNALQEGKKICLAWSWNPS